MACEIHEFGRIAIFIKHGVNYKRELRWKCQHPDCMAIFKKHQVKGKRSICAVCHKNELILDNSALQRAKPRCVYCSTAKADIEKRESFEPIRDTLTDILGDMIGTLPELSEEDQLKRDLGISMLSED